MKKVTYEDWQKNPKPRMMWVWNDDVNQKRKRKVIYIIKEVDYPVMTDTDNIIVGFRNCAEIEVAKKRRMTNQEFSWWLRKNPTREFKDNATSSGVHTAYPYLEEKADDPIDSDIVVRENGGAWHEPLVWR